MCGIMPSANSDNFTYSVPALIPFMCFACLISVARTFNTVLNRSGGRAHPCLVPDLGGNAFRISPLSMMLAMDLSHVAFILLRYVLTITAF